MTSLSLPSSTRSIILSGSLRNKSIDAHLKLNHIHLYLNFYPSGVFVSTDRERKDCEWRERKWKGEVSIV